MGHLLGNILQCPGGRVVSLKCPRRPARERYNHLFKGLLCTFTVLFFLTQVYTLRGKASQEMGTAQTCLCTKEGALNFSFFQHPVTRPRSPCLGTKAQLSWLACWEMNPSSYLLTSLEPHSKWGGEVKLACLAALGFYKRSLPGTAVRRADPP